MNTLSKVTESDIDNMDASIEALKEKLMEDCFLIDSDEDAVEFLITQAMKLGMLHERRDHQNQGLFRTETDRD